MTKYNDIKLLIKEYSEITNKLSLLLNSGNIVGAYAEFLVCELFDLTKARNSKKDIDI